METTAERKLATADGLDELGPIGVRVAANVRRLREAKGWSLQDLADALEQIGHPIPRSGLGKLELRSRRVDVDALVALALALDVNPSALLLPSVIDASELLLTSSVAVSPSAAWEWVDGTFSLASSAVVQRAVDTGTGGQVDVDELNASNDDFRRRVRPRGPITSESHPAVRAATELLDRVKGFVHDPLTTPVRRVRTRITELTEEIDAIEGQS